jgi:hypothetical protein
MRRGVSGVDGPYNSTLRPRGGPLQVEFPRTVLPSMRPLVVLLGIVMGSTVSIAAALLMTGVVFLLLPEHSERLADESRPLLTACALSLALAAVAATSFYSELRTRTWRFAAHLGLGLMLALAAWTYWPRK